MPSTTQNVELWTIFLDVMKTKNGLQTYMRRFISTLEKGNKPTYINMKRLQVQL
jgi:hypothetical protein